MYLSHLVTCSHTVTHFHKSRSDINTIQGKYPIPANDGIPGHEGVAEVVSTGPEATLLHPGDRVVPLQPGLGTWRTHGVFPEDQWHRVSPDIPLEDAATMTINPGTALGMLEHFCDLREGDVIVQNGANSAVGECVIRIAKSRGVHTVNVVRDRPDWDSVVARLKTLGASVVATPENVREAAKATGLLKPRLALNCVGGESATVMAKMLADSGTLVTYGGMSLQPVTIPTPLLIFRDIRLRGFWISGNSPTARSVDAKRKMLDRISELVLSNTLKVECEAVQFVKWQQAFAPRPDGVPVRKKLLVMGDTAVRC
jgi:mitochondrial enoyl-[acyl-carrier protein] reductase / trans-2-enoyl-CoA reductase